MSSYDQEDHYPTKKIKDCIGQYSFARDEDSYWLGDLEECLDTLNEKLGSPRLTKLHQLWYSGFEDLELKRLERSLPKVQTVLDDIRREDKDLRLWKVQYKQLKELLYEAGDILDDIALRAPDLKQLFQSPQVTPHPYLTGKLLQINNLIRELNNLAAEIQSMVLPEFNTPAHLPSHHFTGEEYDQPAATPGDDEISVYYSIAKRPRDPRDRSDHKEITPHLYDIPSASEQEDGENHDTESMEPRKNHVADRINILEDPLIIRDETNTTTNIGDLPKHLERCLLYTSLFPKNYEFEKEVVVQMWIAVGYIQSQGKKLMEDTASGYFEDLLSMSLFKVATLDESRYILPDDVYNMIQESAVAEAEYARLEDGNLDGISSRTLHSSVLYENTVDPLIFKSFNKLKGLHSLLFLHQNRRYITQIPYDLMLSLKCIRVLDLSGTQLTKLPSSIGDMKNLHYLDLSGTRIRSLPGSISSLSSLEVLRLRDCLSFVELPKNMKIIISLRHLDLDIIRQLTFMPPRMGRLTKLQTLSAFIAGKERGFQIAELKNMINLRGSLSIVKLENVGTLEEAEEAALCDKEYLHKLVFQWSMPCLNAEEVLKGLEPNKNLTDLDIVCYGGSTFPAWLGDSTFSKLANIHIYNSKNATLLPLLGRLPSLKTLRIAEMHTLDAIDEKFSQGSSNTGFPKLEMLEFDGMNALEEWTGLPENGMPRLRTLTIADCPNLVSLPELSNLKCLQHLEISFCLKLLSLGEERLPTSLQTLVITDCPNLKEGYLKEAVYWHKIEDIPNVRIDYQHIS